MVRPRWSDSFRRGDFMPIIAGGLILFVSLPPFVLVLLAPDRNSGAIGLPLEIILAIGIVVGVGFTVFGIRRCAFPGTLLYRLSRGRIFTR